MKENPMRTLKVAKVTANMGVGEGGEKLAKAETLLETLVEQKPVKTYSKSTNQTFDIRQGLPIACKATLRGEKAEKFLRKALEAMDHKLRATSFDNHGNVSFGIREHIEIPGMKYDPNIGIFGMDVAVTIERPGYRIKRRSIKKRISKEHWVTREEAMKFIQEGYNVTIETEGSR